MTIRNTIATFGMRSVVALAVLAVVALAALLAVGSPASAQTLTGTEIWSATMTVGNFPLGKGYAFGSSGRGSLSDRTFSSGPNTIAFNLILEAGSPSKRVHVAFDHKLDDNELESLTLVFDSDVFDFEDATYSLDATYGHSYSWPKDPLFGWAEGATVALAITAVPVISIEAVTTTVEYGGNSNAAESTAEFKFTRYGSTDEELSFKLRHGTVFDGETLTRKFNAGQSSFSNFHWAVDVDSNGNPSWCAHFVASTFWKLPTSLHGDPENATVKVEGPGTTCHGRQCSSGAAPIPVQ